MVSSRTGCESVCAQLNLSTQNHVQYVRPEAGGNGRSPTQTRHTHTHLHTYTNRLRDTEKDLETQKSKANREVIISTFLFIISMKNV